MEEAAHPTSKLPPWWAVLLLVPFVALALRTDSSGFWSDNAAYLLLAKALVTGRGYVNIYWPGATPHSHFPPGYALFLSPVVALFGAKAFPAFVLMAVTGVATVVMSYVSAISRGLSRKESLALFFIFGTSPLFWHNSCDISSDTPFALTVMIAVYFADRAGRSDRLISRDLLLAIVFMIVGYYFRTVGMALIAGCSMYLLVAGSGPVWKRLCRGAIAGGISAAAALPWMIYTQKISHDTYFSILRLNGDGSMASYGELILRAWPRLIFYCATFVEWNIHGTTIIHRHLPAVFWLAIIPVTGVTVLGIARSLVRRESAGEFFILFYMILILPWFYYFDRFLLPALVFFLIDFYSAAKKMAYPKLGQINKMRLSRGLLALVGALVAVNLAGNVRYMKKRITPNAPREDFFAASNWVRDHTPADAIIYCRISIPASLNGDRVADENSLYNPPDRAMELISRSPRAFLLTQELDSGFSATYTRPLLQKFPARFREIYRAPGGTSVLYEVLPAPPG